MKIAALGDAHVGRASYPISSQGINVREHDFEISFQNSIDLILEQNPDLILFLGDIFDFPRPSFRSFRVVQRELFKIRKARIPLVGISGNHDTPRLGGTESPYAALHDVFPEFGLIYRQSYEYFDFPGVRIHGVPQMLNEQDTIQALTQASSNRSLQMINLVITHPRVRQLAPSHADINEINLDAETIGGDFALLGHYHFNARVKENMWYVGSTDTFSFGDNPEIDKGIGVLDTDSGQFAHLPVSGRRKLVDLGVVSAIGLSAKEIEELIFRRVEGTDSGSVVRLLLDGVDPGAFRLVDLETVKEMTRHLLYFKLEPQYLSAAVPGELPALETMPAKWARFVDTQDLEAEKKPLVISRGIDYITKAIESS